MPISIAIADDHTLVAEAFANLIQKFDAYQVSIMAANGRDLLNQLCHLPLPDIALVDLTMPVMDGFETTAQLRELYPSVRVLALSMSADQEHIVRIMHNGARGYLLKGCRAPELRQALDDVMEKGMHYSDFLTSQLLGNLNKPVAVSPASAFDLNNREYRFLKMACSELTYNQIADQMCVSPRTVDGYREMVFQKMSVRSRVGMVIKAVRYKLVDL
ncbi:response regulator transcription factor [Spirosoma rhododendri]|uniref:Response regulator transcription factor n=1 Tax=Spirosoma rhododendri TaxID=2728024 RepID=A0A7L5DLZ4_9BACT|nr:response regulator transcription factor [Spirosoma rhododendri]QJD77458.1 response regulator transcription factor [Spirosoma rhododendri]